MVNILYKKEDWRSRKIKDKDIVRIKYLYNQGKSLSSIARQFNVYPTTIKRWVIPLEEKQAKDKRDRLSKDKSIIKSNRKKWDRSFKEHKLKMFGNKYKEYEILMHIKSLHKKLKDIREGKYNVKH